VNSIDSIDSIRCPCCGLAHAPAPGSFYALDPTHRPAPRPPVPDMLRELVELLGDPNHRDCVRSALLELLTEPIVDMVVDILKEAKRR
jgi:hypothetical protein